MALWFDPHHILISHRDPQKKGAVHPAEKRRVTKSRARFQNKIAETTSSCPVSQF